MTTFFILYLIALPLFIVIDMLWLGVAAKDLYKEQIGGLLKDEVNWSAAIAFYLIFIAGLTLFVLLPGVESGSWIILMILAALFGLVTYSAYDLTNLATMKDWPVYVTIIDIVWGVLLTVIVASLTFLISSTFGF